jgi:hypothetical protein
MTTTSTQRTSTRRDRGFIALLLITAGALMLAERAVPLVDSPIVLVLGIETLIWAVMARSDGLVIAGGLLTASAPASCLPQAGSRERTRIWSALPSCSASLSVSRWSRCSPGGSISLSSGRGSQPLRQE